MIKSSHRSDYKEYRVPCTDISEEPTASIFGAVDRSQHPPSPTGLPSTLKMGATGSSKMVVHTLQGITPSPYK